MGHCYHEAGDGRRRRRSPENSLIQMESLFLGRGEQPFAQDFLVRIVRQLQIMDTGIDGRVRTLAGVHLPNHG